MFRLVTGRIGSGKSQVMSILRDKGFRCIGTDDLSRGYRSNPAFFKRTVEIFGRDCLDGNGNIDLPFLWKEFMAKTDNFERYDNYTAECIAKYLKLVDSTEPVFVEVALVQKHISYLMESVDINEILYVNTDDMLRIGRLLDRGLTRDRIDFVDSVQDKVSPFWDKDAQVVDNNHGKDVLARNVCDALEKFKFDETEREALFQRLYAESPAFVKPNVRCYMYYNMRRCSKCPFPCSQADWHFKEARKEVSRED